MSLTYKTTVINDFQKNVAAAEIIIMKHVMKTRPSY